MKKKRKGFTLIEVLAAVTILGIISVVAAVSVSRVIQSAKEQHYTTAEDQLKIAGQSYAQQNRNILPKSIGQKNKIPLKTLMEKNYIKQIKDYSDNNCDIDKSYVQIFKYSQNDYSYIAYLDCPAYTSKETIEKGSPKIDITISDPDKTKKAKADIKITDKEKLLSWSYIIYKDGEEIKNSGSTPVPNYDKSLTKTISLAKYTPGKIKVVVTATNIYGLTTTKTSNAVDFKDTKGPICVIKEVDNKANSKPWTKGPVTITVGCDDGEGSGCKRKEFTKTFKETTNVGEIIIEDKSGNKTTCEVSVNIDVTPPTVPKVNLYKWKNNSTPPQSETGLTSYTAGSWSAQNIYSKATSSTDSGSGLAKYQYTITGSAPNKTAIDGQTVSIETTGTSSIKYRACDNLGNCSAYSTAQTIKVDKVFPSCVSSGGNTAWTNGNRTLTGKCSDSHSGCSADASRTFTTDMNSTTQGPGTVSDKAGNVTTCPQNQTVKIDKTPPTAPTTGAIGNVSGTNPAASIQTAASGSTDNLSGVSHYLYVIKKASGTPAKTDSGFTKLINYTRECGKTYYAYAIAVDNAGNESAVKSLGATKDGVNKYSEPGTCSAKCNGGTQTRTNSCALITTELSQECNKQKCCSETYTKWDAWKGCDVSCGKGNNTRDGTTYSKYDDRKCGTTSETKTCDTGISCGPPSHTHQTGVLGTTLKSCNWTLSCGTYHPKAYWAYCGICWNYGVIYRSTTSKYCPGRYMDGCKNWGTLFPNVVPD